MWSSGVPVVHTAFSKPTTYDTLTIQTTTAAPGNAPDDGASMHDRMHFLHTQLDSLGNRRLLDRFMLSGPHERRQGGAHPPPAQQSLSVALRSGVELRTLHSTCVPSSGTQQTRHTCAVVVPCSGFCSTNFGSIFFTHTYMLTRMLHFVSLSSSAECDG